MNRIAAVVAGLSLAFVGTSTSFAATINVPSDHATIQDAINASSNGDVIAIAAGTYYEHSLNPGGKAITIEGALNGDGSLATTIDAQQGSNVFYLNGGEGDGTVLKDLVITGGSAGLGAGIRLISSSPTITGCTISNNMASYGAGIYCNESNPTISDCAISGNAADERSGGITCNNNSNPTISGCTISGNTSPDGGGIYCYLNSNPTITDCTICGNEPDQITGPYTDGGGNTVSCYCGDAITFNVPGDYATIQGAIDAACDGVVISIASGTYNEHSLNPGGKAITIEGTLNGDGSLATTIDAQQGSNVFYLNGGEGDGTVLKDLVITGGSAGLGAGIRLISSSPTITGCTISNNMASYGAGIYCNESNPTISDCAISGNAAAERSGGITCNNNSNPTISGCTISGNTSPDGGGIYCYPNSNPTITDCTICGNEPDQITGPYTDGGGNLLADECPAYPSGACCLGGTCIPATESDCTTAGGTYAGDDVACADAGCSTPPVTGACCVSSGCVANTNDDCTALGGTWLGEGGSCDDCPASCMGDTDGNGVVNIEDLLNMLGSWGACP